MRRIWVIVFALLFSTVIGCKGVSTSPTPSPNHRADSSNEQPDAPVTEVDLAMIAKQYPAVDGSTSALPLQVMLACTLLDVPCSWQEGWELDMTRKLVPDLNSEAPTELVEQVAGIWHNGTHDSYRNLLKGNADFILVARTPSEDELEEAQDRDVELDIRAVALDAFVFLVNTENPVDELSLATIRSIFAGEITQWSEIDPDEFLGQEDEIHTFSRNRNSGSQELMEKLVMMGVDMIDSPDMMLASMLGPINAIGEDPLGIGYSVYFYAKFIYPSEDVKLLGIDGVQPTSENIAGSSYPLSTEVYVVIRQGMPADHSAVLLRNWLLTDEGQIAIASSGYVPSR